MKWLRLFWIFPVLLLVAVGTVSCSKKDPNVLYYTCPMHPQIQKPKMDRCSICGMSLVPVKKGEELKAQPMPDMGHEGHEGHSNQ